MLNTPELRADYLVRHYWDNMDFTDTTYINLPDVTEQAWVDFIDILKIVPDTTAIAAIKQMYKMADQKKVVFFYYTDLAENICMIRILRCGTKNLHSGTGRHAGK